MGSKAKKRRRRQREQGASRAEAREAARLARRGARKRFETTVRRRRALRRIAFWSALVAVLAGGGYLLFRPGPEVAGVEKPRDEGSGHVASAVYSTATPTSGAHLAGAPACGSYGEPLEPGLAVHALEHGVVVVWYRKQLEDRLRQPLLDLMKRWGSHVIVSPNDRITDPVVATAWDRLKRYRDPSDVAEFIKTYRKRGPESVPCDIEG